MVRKDNSRKLLVLALCVCLSVLVRTQTPVGSTASPEYVVGIPDVLTVTVWKQADLSGKFSVDADGKIGFPLVGRVQVAGLQVKDVEAALTKLLSDGYLKNPQVSVSVEGFRSQQIFVVGEVRLPGAYPLNGDLTLVEALARAGSISDTAGGEIVLMRRGDTAAAPAGPVLPGMAGATELARVDIRDLRAGRVSENMALQDGDTIFVTKAEVIFVFGEVNAPGSYVMERGMTVLRALNLAGGATQLGATGRVRIRRLVDGKVTEVRVKLTDTIQAGDEVVVPKRLI